MRNLIVAAAAALMLTSSASGESWPPPQKIVTVPVVILDGNTEQGTLTVNQIGLFSAEVVIACFAKPNDTDALCYILQPNGKVYATKRLMRAVPA